jgi:FkbM family methyltransferase
MLSEVKLKLEESARDFFLGTPLFSPVRDGYQSIFARDKLAIRREMRAFYAPYIRRDDLVFDIGAYFGTYAERFTELGAKVVAVEPNPACCETLRRLARGRNIQVVNCAAGDTPGKSKLLVCLEYPSLSTVADEWYDAAQRSSRHGTAHWQKPIEVDILTLDQLAERYGVPAFVKIDVEGFDDHVIRGMSFQPRFLTFEFNREVPQIALRCLEAPLLRSGYEFNYSCSMTKLASDHWMGPEELRGRIFDDENYYGDVLARRKD